jgi:hypothetical protein
MGELRRHVFVFVGPNVNEDGNDLPEGLRNFARNILGWQVESLRNLPLTAKVRIDTEEGTT